MKSKGWRIIWFCLLLSVIAQPAWSLELANTPCSSINRNAKTLVVLLHAFTASPDSLRDVVRTLQQTDEYAAADFVCPALPFGVLSLEKPGVVVADLLQGMDQLWQGRIDRGQPYERILLVGHSMGSLFARKIYVAASGENPQVPFESTIKQRLKELGAASLDQPRPWVQAVDRIVLLAGMNRGWSISHHMSLTRGVAMSLGVAGGRMVSWVTGQPPIILSIHRGAPFITELRLQWLAMRDNKERVNQSIGGALTIQLLGTIDDLVSPEDNIDLVSGKEFIYLDVPYSGHKNVVEMDDTAAGRERARVFSLAATASRDVLEEHQVYPAEDVFEADKTVTDVVFVIHGIRDEGFWTQKIARRIKAHAQNNPALSQRKIRSITSSYGYFPMLSFLHPGARQEKVEWLMDQYTQAKARYPEARFSYVGHSHGTYMLSKALKDYPSVRFENIVFAGSVVPRGYDWLQYIPQQAKAVLNFVASADWVVAFFPKALQSIDVQDLGSAGHDGFSVAYSLDEVFQPQEFINGGHSAALQEDIWDTIATFVLTGNLQPPPESTLIGEQTSWIYELGEIAILLWVVAAIVLLLILVWLLRRDWAQWVKTLAVVFYLSAMWLVLTRV